MTGKFVNMDKHPGTDAEALKDGYVSIVPIRIDFTDTKMKAWMEEEWSDFT